MSDGIPDPLERANTAAATTACAGKKKTVACQKGVRVMIKQKKLKSSIAIPSAEWDLIKDLPGNALLYGTCYLSSAKGCFKIKFDCLPCDKNEVSCSDDT